MKKLFLFSMLSALLALTSCNKQETELNPNAGEITFDLQSDEIVTRNTPLTYIVDVYEISDLNTRITRATSTNTTLKVTGLENNIQYTFLFWADSDDSGIVYDKTSLQAVALKSGATPTDAFFAKYVNNGDASDTANSIGISLKRGVARVNLIDTDNSIPTSSVGITFLRAGTFDVMTGSATNETSVSLAITPTTPNESTKEFGSFLTFADATTRYNTNFTFTYGSETKEVNNVPLQANYITNIKSSF